MGPIHTLGGASVEISWREGRLDDKHSKSHQDASSHPEAKLHPEAEPLKDRNLHPEVELHPEVNVLALADSLGIRKLKFISQRVQEPDCTMIRNVNYFLEIFGAELI